MIGLHQGDITTASADAIVCSAGGALAEAIHRAAGRGVAEALALLGGCRVGEAKTTHAGALTPASSCTPSRRSGAAASTARPRR